MESWQKILLSLIIIGEVIGIIIFVSAKDFETARVGWMMGLFFLLIPSVGAICYNVWSRQRQQEQRREIELNTITQNNQTIPVREEVSQGVSNTNRGGSDNTTSSDENAEALEREISDLEKRKRIAELKKEIRDLESQVASASTV